MVAWTDRGLGNEVRRQEIVEIRGFHACEGSKGRGLVNRRGFCYRSRTMKADIHPTYFPKAKIVCACGNVVMAGSTVEEIHVELCSACHPFYTGKQKLIDTARRVEKFQEKAAAKSSKASVLGKKAKTVKRAAQKVAKKAQKKPTHLHEA